MIGEEILAKTLVRTYFLVHGKLHLPGAGWLLRRLAPWFSSLRAFALPIPNVGTAVIDFREESAYGVLNMYLGEHGEDRLPDIPFEPASGEVLFRPSSASLKRSPPHTAVIRLLAVGESGDRLIADYTFNHTPS